MFGPTSPSSTLGTAITMISEKQCDELGNAQLTGVELAELRPSSPVSKRTSNRLLVKIFRIFGVRQYAAFVSGPSFLAP